MDARLTEQGRAVIDGAHTAAAGLGHAYVGTEHMLLALAHDPSGAALLSELGVDQREVEAAIARHHRTTPSPEPSPPAAVTTGG